jgi:transcriptional regulator with XRE-family HTH domain
MARTKNALTILDALTGNDFSVREGIADARINLEVGQMIYDARVGAGLSQRQLAKLIGSKQPVIARLEDAGYEGHSLTMLQRIAEVLQQRLEVRFVPSSKRRAARATLRAPQRRKLQPA